MSWLLLLGIRLQAADFDLAVATAPSPVLVNMPLTYSINVTNRSGLTLTNVVVTSRSSESASLLSATNFWGTVTNLGPEVVFQVDPLTNQAFARMSVTVRPTAFGLITNVVIVAATNAMSVTNRTVTTVYTAQADLGVTLAGPAPGVLVNDLMTYTLNVTNQGPGSAPNVVLSNRLPADVKLISPTNQTFTNSSLLFSLGTVINGGWGSFNVIVQPTNAGSLVFSASVSAQGLLDTHPANDSASSNIVVGDFLPGQLVATLVSTQRYNPQTGLMEQRILLTNAGTNDVPSARVVVSGLTNWLFNAVGTNAGNPFVIYASTLLAGATNELLLEIFVPTRGAVTNLDLEAIAVPLVAVSPPAGTPVHINRIIRLSSGEMLLEFSSVTNQRFAVLYCSDPAFSTNVLVAQPLIVAPADRTQWIDNGPPRTLSRPPGIGTTNTARFYRVRRTP